MCYPCKLLLNVLKFFFLFSCSVVRPVKLSSLRGNSGPVTLTSQLSATSRDGSVSLQILSQPEQQHRARYQTEGSRGAVKDRTGNGFPVVKVIFVIQIFSRISLLNFLRNVPNLKGHNLTYCGKTKSLHGT